MPFQNQFDAYVRQHQRDTEENKRLAQQLFAQKQAHDAQLAIERARMAQEGGHQSRMEEIEKQRVAQEQARIEFAQDQAKKAEAYKVFQDVLKGDARPSNAGKGAIQLPFGEQVPTNPDAQLPYMVGQNGQRFVPTSPEERAAIARSEEAKNNVFQQDLWNTTAQQLFPGDEKRQKQFLAEKMLGHQFKPMTIQEQFGEALGHVMNDPKAPFEQRIQRGLDLVKQFNTAENPTTGATIAHLGASTASIQDELKRRKIADRGKQIFTQAQSHAFQNPKNKDNPFGLHADIAAAIEEGRQKGFYSDEEAAAAGEELAKNHLQLPPRTPTDIFSQLGITPPVVPQPQQK